MTTIQEVQRVTIEELKREKGCLEAQLVESREANAKLRHRVGELKDRNAQLERCIVEMALERCEGEH